MPPGDFSNKKLSNLYDEFRPSYPACLVDTIISACRNKWACHEVTNDDAAIDDVGTNDATNSPIVSDDVINRSERGQEKCLKELCAIDVACGTGIFTRLLSPHFGKVIGVDLSPTQIEVAKKVNEQNPGLYDNITYITCGAFDLVDILRDQNVKTDQVCLITIAEALHWLDIPKFCQFITSSFPRKTIFAPVAYPYPDFMHQGLETPGFKLINPELLCDSYDDKNFQMDKYFRECVEYIHPRYLSDVCWMGTYFRNSGFENHFKTVEFYGFLKLQNSNAYLVANLIRSLSRYQSYVTENEGVSDPVIELVEKLLEMENLGGERETKDFSSEKDEKLLKRIKFQLRWKYFCYALSN